MSDEDTNDRREARHTYRNCLRVAQNSLEAVVHARHVLVDEFSDSDEDVGNSSLNLEQIDKSFKSTLNGYLKALPIAPSQRTNATPTTGAGAQTAGSRASGASAQTQTAGASGSGSGATSKGAKSATTKKTSHKDKDKQTTPANSGPATTSSTSSSGAAANTAVLTSTQMADLWITFREKPCLTPQEFLAQVVATPKSIPVSRLEALHNATRGVELITQEDAVHLFQDINKNPYDAKTLLESYHKDFQSLRRGTLVENVQVTKSHWDLQNIDTGSLTQTWVQTMVCKLMSAHFARRWYTKTSHDPQFPSRMYRSIWAVGLEGRNALNDQDIEDPEMQRLFGKELKRSKKKEEREVVARNRLLQMYARFGPMVILDPSWQMRSFRNQATGPVSQAGAINYYNRMATEVDADQPHPLAENCLAAEWMIVYAISQLYTDGLNSPQVVMIKNVLWELRRCSLIHRDPTPPLTANNSTPQLNTNQMSLNFPVHEEMFERWFKLQDNLIPAGDMAELPPVHDASTQRGRARQALKTIETGRVEKASTKSKGKRKA